MIKLPCVHNCSKPVHQLSQCDKYVFKVSNYNNCIDHYFNSGVRQGQNVKDYD